MRRGIALSLLIVFLLPACSGVSSEIKKSWSNSANTINIADLTSRDSDLMDAGSRLHDALEDSLTDTSFILAGENSQYRLKFKVIVFDEGNRIVRLATLGISDSGKAQLKVKIALFNGDSIVGAWVVDSWLTGGMTGGSDSKLFTDAAKEIILHLKGDL